MQDLIQDLIQPLPSLAESQHILQPGTLSLDKPFAGN